MSVTPPLPIDDLPITPSPDRPDTFDPEADAFLEELQPWGQQVEAVGQNAYANAVDAAASAVASAGSATESAGSATAAAGSATAASGSATAAAGSATAAAGSATAAANSATAAATSATGLTATSTTSFAVGNGSKVFVTQAGKQFPNDLPLSFSSAATPTLRMFGTVDSYSGTSLTVTIASFEGSGAAADWVIAPTGAKGATGGTAGGQLTSALDEKKGTSPASSATPDIWAAGGNYVPITQTAAITGFPNAPQAGARRTLFIINGAPIVADANLFVRGGSRNLQPGDRVTIEADTVSTFSATIERGSGLPTTPSVFTHAEMYTATSVFTVKLKGAHRAIVVGTGGSGGLGVISGGSSTAVSATGGAAGGMAIKDFDGVVGDAYTFVAGAPGTYNLTTNADGVAGTATTFSGTGVSITCNGGAGGKFTNTAAALAGSAGGTATGGDYNYQGGGSGSCGAMTGGGRAYQATGGGAVAWNGIGYASGDVSYTVSISGNPTAASGGASTGGRSGSVTLASGINAASGGAGAAGPSPNVTTAITGAKGPGFPLLNVSPINLIGGASDTGFASTPQPGTASNGILTGTLNPSGMFAGLGGTATANLNNGVTSTTFAGLGAGSGGVSVNTTYTAGGVANGGLPLLIILY